MEKESLLLIGCLFSLTLNVLGISLTFAESNKHVIIQLNNETQLIVPNKELWQATIPSELTVDIQIDNQFSINNLAFKIEPSHKYAIAEIQKREVIDQRVLKNLFYEMLIWKEKIQYAGLAEIEERNHYLVVMNAKIFFYIVENNIGIEQMKICTSLISTQCEILVPKYPFFRWYDSNSTSRFISFFPILPTHMGKDNQAGEFHLIMERNQEYPSPFMGFVGVVSLLKEVYGVSYFASDLGFADGFGLSLYSNKRFSPIMELYLIPGNRSSSFHNRRIQIDGKIVYLLREINMDSILTFCELKMMAYMTKTDQWQINFENPITGYIDFNGKLSSIFKAHLYVEPENSKSAIEGTCRIGRGDPFSFATPMGVETLFPIPPDYFLPLPKVNKPPSVQRGKPIETPANLPMMPTISEQ